MLKNTYKKRVYLIAKIDTLFFYTVLGVTINL